MKRDTLKAGFALGVFFFLFQAIVSGEERGGEWTKTFGGAFIDVGYSIQQTLDYNYIIAGQYGVGGSDYDVWLIKTDRYGNKQWDKRFGGSSWDVGQCVQPTPDGGYIITGYTRLGTNPANVWLIKTDMYGNKQWDKIFGGSKSDIGWSVCPTIDGGYVIAGTTSSYGAGNGDMWLIKTDQWGNKQWDKTFGGPSFDKAHSVVQTLDGGYFITGATTPDIFSPWDVHLVKTDIFGNPQWQKTFGGSDIDEAYSGIQGMDGGYVVAGSTDSYGAGASDVWLLKLDFYGTLQWSRTFGGTSAESAFCVRQTIQDAGYLISGGTHSFGAGDYDAWLIKTDYYGNMQWTKTFGGVLCDYGYCVVQDQVNVNDYVIIGGTTSFGAGSNDVYMVHASPATLWCNTYTIPQSGGKVTFQLDAGSENGFRDYILLGGVTGTEPGTPLPKGTTLLLNWDPFTDIVLSLANTPIFTNFMGQLDASGQAAAQLNVPPVPEYAGLVMFYAYTLFSPFGFASNAVTMTIEP